MTRLPVSLRRVAFILVSFFLTQTLSGYIPSSAYAVEPGYYQFDKKKKGIQVTGRVYRIAPNKVLVEVWPRPYRKQLKIKKISMKSPSGKVYRSSEIEQFPLSQIYQKRSQYIHQSSLVDKVKSRLLAFLQRDWLPEAQASCGEDHGSGGGSGGTEGTSSEEGTSRRDAEAFAAFGALAGIAGTTENHYISTAVVNIDDQDGEWNVGVVVTDDRGQNHRFNFPVNLTYISSVDHATGETTTVVQNDDGSVTVTVTDADGNLISTTTRGGDDDPTDAGSDDDDPTDVGSSDDDDPTDVGHDDDDGSVIDELTPWGGFPGTVTRTPGGTTTTSSGGGGTTTTGEDDDDDEGPRDTPPPTIYGEEIDNDERVGILLIRDNDGWLPEYDNATTVTAKIYEPDPRRAGVWLPSDSKRRVITSLFAERSNEKGRCMNVILNSEPEDSPDMFFEKDLNPGTECEDDPVGKGYFGKCTTADAHNQYTFYLTSEDFGSFTKLEATCEDCVGLVKVAGLNHNSFPVAVEEPVREKRLVTVPMDNNDNQIGDAFPGQYTVLADDDKDKAPVGEGTEGDGYSAYEEYRGFGTKDYDHTRVDWDTKTLFVENTIGFPGVDKFGTASGMEVYEITIDQLDAARVVNFNSGHANVVDQHGLTIVPDIIPGYGGMSMGFGPPKNVDRIRIDIASAWGGMGSTGPTVTHELGHGTGVRHHGDTATWKEYWRAPGTWWDYNPGSNIWSGATMCGTPLPGDVEFGKKGNQSSGVHNCYMRYYQHGDAFRQEDGSVHCHPVPPGRSIFCESTAGTSFNAGNRVAGNATKGDCKHQFIVNDNS